MSKEDIIQDISGLQLEVDRYNLSATQSSTVLSILERPMFHIEDPQFENQEEMDQLLEQSYCPEPSATLSTDITINLFIQLNYSRFKINKLRDHLLQEDSINSNELDQLLSLFDKQLEIRGQIATGNMGLVLAMAKQSSYPGVEFTDLVSEGSMALLRSVDKFNYNLGFKFSTYSCRAIKKSFSRIAQYYYRYRNLFSVQFESSMEQDNYQEHVRESLYNDHVDDIKSIFMENMAELTRTERTVVSLRFSLENQTEKRLTLKQVGQRLSLSKERIRQIQNNALEKMRTVAHEHLSAMS